MITPNAQAFDDWIRGRFCEINTELENLYFAREDKADVHGVGPELKRELCHTGRDLIASLVKEGNTDEGFEAGFNLLGNVGFYMAACARHEIGEAEAGPSAHLREASALAMEVGASLGVTPRFATSHLTTHNLAVNGRYKSFTSLQDEYVFVDYNNRGILAYKRAAEALLKVLPLGVTHPIAPDLFEAAHDALEAVRRSNEQLSAKLDVDRFFYSVRPYYKPHKVGFNTYRGANAGDFAGINVLDLLLGLCQSNQASYSQLLVEKFLYMMPQDQLILRDCMRQTSLLNSFMTALPEHGNAPWFQANVASFLKVVDAFGETSRQHHNMLVERFIRVPSQALATQHHDNLTASGPPLPVLLAGLEKLRDQRCAAPREDIPTRYADVQALRALIA
ncbi:DUF1864 family protein [Burkholderiaceae bacterium DAT-1]|nr:DUF1864 family protein [Burkholderiaceae bacterium DAT-1]